MAKRRLIAVGISIAAIIVTGGTTLAASNLKTVAQKAAEEAPPAPSRITSQIVKKQLIDSVDVTCKPGFEREERITGAAKSPRILTSSTLETGATVADGTLLGEVNGSPVFAIVGAFPLYRDLKIKDSGPDARLVNEALVRMGRLLPLGEPSSSTINAYTVEAVTSLFVDSGYPAPKRDAVIVSMQAFQVLAAPGVVSGNPHPSGDLGTSAIASIGVGAYGLICATSGGEIPVEAKTGQMARVPSLGSKPLPVRLISKPAAASNSQPTASEISSGPGNSGSAGPNGTGDRSTQAAEENAMVLFIETGKGTSLAPLVPASLILSSSKADALVVPSSALWTKGELTYLSVVDGNEPRDVAVTVQFSASGQNAIAPVDASEILSAGQEVVVSGNQE